MQDAVALAVAYARRKGAFPLVLSVMDFEPVPESRVVMVGTRDYDPLEAQRLAQSAIKRVGAKDVVTSLDAALDDARAETDELYLHLDLDVLDFSDGIANGYACPGGLMRAEVLDVVDRVANRFRIAGAAITAYDPEHGQDPRVEQLAIEVAKARRYPLGFEGVRRAGCHHASAASV